MVGGAKEAQLPESYEDYLKRIDSYNPPITWRARAGANLVLLIWAPVMRQLEYITNRSIGPDGNASPFVVWLVRSTMYWMWLVHDLIFAPIFGPGDGNGQYSKENGEDDCSV
jgi:gliotoxin/aspirochlorine biosynthesis gamma-glutamylcyclotransferase